MNYNKIKKKKVRRINWKVGEEEERKKNILKIYLIKKLKILRQAKANDKL